MDSKLRIMYVNFNNDLVREYVGIKVALELMLEAEEKLLLTY